MKETDSEIQVLIEKYRDLEKGIEGRMNNIFTNGGLMIHIAHRIKTLKSIKGKLKKTRPRSVMLLFIIILPPASAARIINVDLQPEFSRYLSTSEAYLFMPPKKKCPLSGGGGLR